MKGTAFGVGVGPGDPELITVKAIRLIHENEVIAVPGREAKESVAYQIAVQAVPELREKKLISIPMPMVKDRGQIEAAHREGAALIKHHLDKGENVVYLTLGDPTIYCSFRYLQRILETEGYPVVLVSGVPSFCAAAARLNLPLAEWDEALHVIPSAHSTAAEVNQPGTCVLMKSGGQMKAVKEMLRSCGREASAVLNCGMEGEQICRRLEEIPDDAGYFSLIISRPHGGRSQEDGVTIKENT